MLLEAAASTKFQVDYRQVPTHETSQLTAQNTLNYQLKQSIQIVVQRQ